MPSTNYSSVAMDEETRERLTQAADRAGLKLDQYLRRLAREIPDGDAPPKRSSGGGGTAPSPLAMAEQMRETMRSLPDILTMRIMMQGMGMGGGGMGFPTGGGEDRLEALREELRELRAQLESAPSKKGSEDDSLDKVLNTLAKMRTLDALADAMGGGGRAKAGQEQSEERRRLEEKLEKQREEFLRLTQAHQEKLSQFERERIEEQKAALEQRIAETSERIRSLEETLNSRLNAPPEARPDPMGEVSRILSDYARLNQEIQKIAKAHAPAEPPKPGQEMTDLEKVSYLLRTGSEAASNAMESYAKVLAAQKGRSPDTVGTMPPTTEAQYQPVYAPDEPVEGGGTGTPAEAPAPAPPQAPLSADAILRSVAPSKTASPPPSSTPPPAPAATPPPQPTANLPTDPKDMPDVPYYGLNGEPVTKEEFARLREEIRAQTGKDPVMTVDTDEKAGATENTDAGATDAASE